jgi:hypothetical protein
VPSSVFFNHHLETLNLSNASLKRKASLNLSQMIRDSSSLKSLGLESVQIDSAGLVSVMAAIVMSRSLTTLKLGDLEWSKKDIQRLLVAASFNRSITKLSLEGMRLDADDAQELAKFLQRNKSVTQLSLRKNNLDAEAVRILVSEGVLRNNTLQKLFLSRNCLGDESAKYVTKLLTECTSTLQELCLVETKIVESGCMLLPRLCATTLAYAPFPWMVTSSSHAGNSFWNPCSITRACKVCWIGCRRFWRGKVGTFAHGTRWNFCCEPTKPTVVSCKTKAFNSNTCLLSCKARVCNDVFFHFLSNSANHFPTAAMARKPNNSPPRTFVPSDKLPERSAAAATPLRRQCACFPPSA